MVPKGMRMGAANGAGQGQGLQAAKHRQPRRGPRGQGLWASLPSSQPTELLEQLPLCQREVQGSACQHALESAPHPFFMDDREGTGKRRGRPAPFTVSTAAIPN